LTGTGLTSASTLNTSSSTVTFGNVNDGTTATQTVTLTNHGNANITISSVTASGTGYGDSGVQSGLMLTPGQTTSLSISFDPSAAGSVNGSVIVASNATNSPLTITLSGTGVVPAQHSVALAWTASTTSGVVGYNVYRGTAEGTYSLISSSVAGTSYTDTTVQSGQDTTYYYVVTAVNGQGVESSDSNIATALVP
jgi:hypothetical protein